MAIETQVYRFNGRALSSGEILIGAAGDNGVRRIAFELPDISNAQLAFLKVNFPVNPAKYPLTFSGNVWSCTIGAGLTASFGIYKASVEVFDAHSELLWNSAQFVAQILPGSNVNDTIANAHLPELLQAEAALREANDRTDKILAAVDAEAERVIAENEREAFVADLKAEVASGAFDGATFTPSVSVDGTLSWENDQGLENPPAFNITGESGVYLGEIEPQNSNIRVWLTPAESPSDFVRYAQPQILEKQQQKQARENIGAAAIDDDLTGPDTWSSQKIDDRLRAIEARIAALEAAVKNS